jgi:hypothetical protein
MKKLIVLAASLALLPGFSFGAAFIYDQFVIVNTTSPAYYDIGASTANPEFNSAVLGTFVAGSDLLRLGGQGKSDKDNSTDVTGMSLFYRVWQGSPSGAFSQLNYAFKTDFGGGNQEWGTDTGSPFYTGNLLNGLTSGSYSLEVYSQINTNSVNSAPIVYNTNSGSNFTAAFTVVPEPSRVLFSLFGLGILMFRRRRA